MMSDEKKTHQTAENEKDQQNGDPFARNESNGKAEEAAAAGEAQSRRDDPGDEVSLRERVRELEERLKRAVAEQENLRKRMEREKADVARYAMANFARDVLGIADNIQRAIDAVPKDATEEDSALKTFLDGIEVTERELHKAMERHGIKKLNPEGEKFDPNYHQAMFEIPTSDQPSGVVVQVMQAGYLLEDRVLRPAMVGVSKAAPAATPANDDVKGAESANATEGAEKTPEHEGPAGGAEAGDRQPGSVEAEEAAAQAADDMADAAAKEEKASAQPRGSSRLNEPVINGETDQDYETEPASRKA